MRRFLDHGLSVARLTDDRLRASRLASAGGPTVKEMAREALRGSEEDLRRFLDEGQHFARLTDYRISVTRIGGAGGPEAKAKVKAGANAGKK